MTIPDPHGECEATIVDLDQDLRVATQQIDQKRAEVEAMHAYVEDCRRRLIEAGQLDDPGLPMWAVMREVTKRLANQHPVGQPVHVYPWQQEATS